MGAPPVLFSNEVGGWTEEPQEDLSVESAGDGTNLAREEPDAQDRLASRRGRAARVGVAAGFVRGGHEPTESSGRDVRRRPHPARRGIPAGRGDRRRHLARLEPRSVRHRPGGRRERVLRAASASPGRDRLSRPRRCARFGSLRPREDVLARIPRDISGRRDLDGRRRDGGGDRVEVADRLGRDAAPRALSPAPGGAAGILREDRRARPRPRRRHRHVDAELPVRVRRRAGAGGLRRGGGGAAQGARAATRGRRRRGRLQERRAALRAALSEDDRKYMDFQIWKEGVARYTQLRVARWAAEHYRPTAAFQALPGYAPFGAVARALDAAISKELAEQKLAEAKRIVFYPYGAAEACCSTGLIHPGASATSTTSSPSTRRSRTRGRPSQTALRDQPPGHVCAAQPVFRVRVPPTRRACASRATSPGRRRGRLRLEGRAAPPGLRRNPERRHLRCAPRLPQQLDRGSPPHEAVRRRVPPCTVTADFHVTLKRPTPLDAPIQLTGARRGVARGPGRRRRDARGRRQGDGDVPRDVRRGRAGTPAYHKW